MQADIAAEPTAPADTSSSPAYPRKSTTGRLLDPYQCSKCGKVFDQKSHFESHLARRTTCTDPKPSATFKCPGPGCHQSYTHRSGLSRHMRTCPLKIANKITEDAQAVIRALINLADHAGNAVAPNELVAALATDLANQLRGGLDAAVTPEAAGPVATVQVNDFARGTRPDWTDLSELVKPRQLGGVKGKRLLISTLAKLTWCDNSHPEHHNVYMHSRFPNIAYVVKAQRWVELDRAKHLEDMLTYLIVTVTDYDTEWEARLSAAELDELQCQLDGWEGELTEPEADWSKSLRDIKHAVQYQLLTACLNRDTPKLGRLPLPPPKPVQPQPPEDENEGPAVSDSEVEQDLPSSAVLDNEELYSHMMFAEPPCPVDSDPNPTTLLSTI
ncbi:hypothetical protein WJX72_001003 [[Myrmecia] bisecta]|uniref:C2H2-type domain-containing protein n=1 Tax=[Myrmecia] bisecta TaxID=41462 RepID=A0AAW1QE37_9CHLO